METNLETRESYPVTELYSHKYTLQAGHTICDLIREGKSIREVASILQVSTGILYHWRSLHPDLNARVLAAYQDRAEYYRDKVQEEVERLAVDEEHIDPKRMSIINSRIENWKWLAKTDNPDRYGDKTKISGDKNAPLTIILDTGIRREAPKPLEDITLEHKEIEALEAASTAPGPEQLSLPLESPDHLPDPHAD